MSCVVSFLSRVITEHNFNSILGTETKSYEGVYTILSSNHLYAQRTIDLDSDVQFVQF